MAGNRYDVRNLDALDSPGLAAKPSTAHEEFRQNLGKTMVQCIEEGLV
jgi:hypothetical protein